MGTIADKLAYLAGTKDAIKAAVAGKGVTVPDGTTFRDYAALIEGIVVGNFSDEEVAEIEAELDALIAETDEDQLSTLEGYTIVRKLQLLQTYRNNILASISGKGVGFVSCNGLNVPVLPELDTAKQYACISTSSLGLVYLQVSDKLGYIDTSDGEKSHRLNAKNEEGELESITCNVWCFSLNGSSVLEDLYPGITTTSWTLFEEDIAKTSWPMDGGPYWTNTTLCDQDGNVFLEASEPTALEETASVPFRIISDMVEQIPVSSGEESQLWAYLNQTTLYINQADSFTQNGTTLEVG